MAGLVFLLIFLALFWVLVVLPQKRMRQAHDALVATVEPGCKIMTTAGLYGTITALDGEIAHLEIAPGVVVRIDKRSVGAVLRDESPDSNDQPELASELGGDQACQFGDTEADEQRHG
ncbi:MAG: preprotein translocase subunit YajC [Acidimicrobiales bacterium]|nr:preprotein translocase subunit YajC [Acidimicrobiales bacterium]